MVKTSITGDSPLLLCSRQTVQPECMYVCVRALCRQAAPKEDGVPVMEFGDFEVVGFPFSRLSREQAVSAHCSVFSFTAHGSRLTAHGSWLTAHGSRLMAH